ncbi:GNAT family N-acetyltransferase [Octadecabacter sp. G9-8]|uniref:GNAT family N-acetyltransferase n=1 Tax=Octadecabacter dasysiphoniae TaxID=2909341 RepID=A0ABS9D0H4_9RHOB|nr:GNAT family N-acetyltransferase [Octadecabacter dasysiphoniae]MCF2872974.1 GNAT family N-acetyltransferase [Octadecabacter dasysiphoniae]
MTNVIEIPDLHRAEALLRTLRPALDDDTYSARLKQAVAHGYTVLGVENGDTLLAVLGYRITFDLCWGKTLYVDDLVVDPALRGGGHGGALLSAAKAIAQDAHCDHIRLCSGLNRHDAHRFYETHGLSGFSKQFILPLKGT